MTTFEPDGEGGWIANTSTVGRVRLGDPESPYSESASVDSEGELCVSLVDGTDSMQDRSCDVFTDGRRLYRAITNREPKGEWEDELLAKLKAGLASDSEYSDFARIARLAESHGLPLRRVGYSPDWVPGMPKIEFGPPPRYTPPSPSKSGGSNATENEDRPPVAPDRPSPPGVPPGTVVMRDADIGTCYSILTASVSDDGDLELAGQDIGGIAERTFGDDYEYSKTFAACDIPRVLATLGESTDANILDVIRRNWCGADRSLEFERRLREAGVPHRFESY